MSVAAKERKFVLPALVTGPGDVERTLLELEQLEEFLRAAALRKGGENTKLPKTSRTLERLAEINDANLLQASDRQHLQAFLVSLQKHAPVMHISFASEPSAAFTAKIVEWLRANISKYVLVQIGLQPSIAAGCVVRTTNKSFDFSLRKHLLKNRDILLNAIKTTGINSSNPDSNGLQPSHLSAVQGAVEQQTESYNKYGEGAAETVTQQRAKSAAEIGGSADKPGSAVGRL